MKREEDWREEKERDEKRGKKDIKLIKGKVHTIS
jgi:hypothetical protein